MADFVFGEKIGEKGRIPEHDDFQANIRFVDTIQSTPNIYVRKSTHHVELCLKHKELHHTIILTQGCNCATQEFQANLRRMYAFLKDNLDRLNPEVHTHLQCELSPQGLKLECGYVPGSHTQEVPNFARKRTNMQRSGVQEGHSTGSVQKINSGQNWWQKD